MSETISQDSLKQLLDKMVASKQLSAIDAKDLAGRKPAGGAPLQTEEDVLRWLAAE